MQNSFTKFKDNYIASFLLELKCDLLFMENKFS